MNVMLHYSPLVFVYLNMVYSHFDICFKLSWCTTSLRTPGFQCEMGSHLKLCSLCLPYSGYTILFFFLLFLISQSISLFWLPFLDFLWTIGSTFWPALEERNISYDILEGKNFERASPRLFLVYSETIWRSRCTFLSEASLTIPGFISFVSLFSSMTNLTH